MLRFVSAAILVLTLSAPFLLKACSRAGVSNKKNSSANDSVLLRKIVYKDSACRFIHVFVALCDNKYQGIVKVNATIGNGQDAANNLYWGCGYGAATVFKRSPEWTLVKRFAKPDSLILERLVFRHKTRNFFMVVEGYNGKYIKECAENAMYSLNGKRADTLHINNKVVGMYGNAALVAFCGHNLLMDDIVIAPDLAKTRDSIKRDAIIIACASKPYFGDLLQQTQARPLLWSTGLMSAEAYTLHDALTGYVNGESAEAVRLRAAVAYNKYQKCGLGAARNLLVTGY